MRSLQALAARFCQPSRLSTAVASARPLAFPGAAASRVASASPPTAPPWAWATSGAGPSTCTSASSSGFSGSFAAWGAAWRSAPGAGGGGVAHMPAGQQLGGVRGLGAAGSFGLQPTASPSVPRSATSLGSRNTLSGPGAAAWSWSGALGARTGGVPQAAGGVTGGVRPVASITARGGPMGMAAAGQLARGMSQSSSGAGGSWRTSLAWAVALTALRFSALYAAVYAYVWYENLEQVPYSGRWRSVRPTLAAIAQEQGPRAHEEVIASYRASGTLLPDDHPDVLLVGRVGAAVVEAAVKGLGDGAAAERLRGLQWEFCVVDDGQASNAFVRPGGKVIMHKSVLDEVYRDDDLLAFVLAHEVAHELAQHTAEVQSYAANARAVIAMVNLLAMTMWVSVLCIMLNVVDLRFASQGVWSFLLPLSWYREFEADAIAMQLMARAGFNPGAAVSYHWLTNNSSTAKICKMVVDNQYLLSRLLPELTSTHPSTESRMQRAWQQLPAACRTYTEAGFGTCNPDESFRPVYERNFIAWSARLEAAALATK